jgi:hypothetical protein
MNKTNDCNNFIQNCCCFHRRKSIIYPKNGNKQDENIKMLSKINVIKPLKKNVFVTVPLD